MPPDEETLHHADLALAAAAIEGDELAIARIVTEHLSQIPAWIARIEPAPAFADDVTQEVAALLFVPGARETSKLAGYSGRGPLGGFLRTVAVRTAQNMLRSRREVAVAEPHAPDAAVTGRATPEGALARHDHARKFADTLRRAILALDPADRELLRLHYVDGLSIEAVAAARSVSRATAARHLARVRESVVAHAKEALGGGAGAGIDLPSQLSLSLSKLFRPQ